MAWDSELEHLVMWVESSLGCEVINQALCRALAALDETKQPLELVDLWSHSEGFVVNSMDGSVVSLDAFHDAVRAELRRLAQPH
jgi:hypothetical protein